MDPTFQKLRDNLRIVIRGKDDCLDQLLAALLAGGHVLIEDLPGLGKTTLAKALAISLDVDFRRVQFTPDLLPADVLGGSVYNATDGSFKLHRGPIFTSVLLADEINRASARTQSALLEAMAEGQATIEGHAHSLPDLFFVMATQNPIEFHGTYPLPEAQLDRFLIRLELNYPDAQTELQVLYDQQLQHPLKTIKSVADAAAVLVAREKARAIHVDEAVGRYVVDLVRATREHAAVRMGASPRGALGLFRMAQAVAALGGRDHVLPEDVQSMAVAVLAHRVVLESRSDRSGAGRIGVIRETLDRVPVPR